MKEKIKEYLLKGDFDRIAKLGEPGRIVRALISLSYDKTQEIAWKSIEAIGRIVYLASKERPDFGGEIIRRLLWSIRDEAGGIGWSSPEIIGEIVRNDPSRYHDIPKILWSFMDEEFLRKGIIWAMGRIGEVAPELVYFASPYLKLIAGNDTDIEMRFYAKWALCKMGEEFESKEPGDIKVVIYDNGELKDIPFSELVTCKKAVRIIERRGELFSHEDFLSTDRQSLRCPFCDSPVDRPGELKNGFADVLGGRCRCGALYAYDPSGRALGEVLMDSLAILCKGDYNKAVSLEEGKDYLVKFFMYEPYMNRLSGIGGSITARRMIFVKILI
ncbi:MAG: DVU0298 family protein [Thermodesulfovibrionales bacterium]